ncbi:uroporphyrinogen-III C-methyltransferase [Exilibacterium tricleocarpae]|uniref:uroporphyrinogen-III C-methyltransferase n=1 Tax=Exilibacterium tricleocarpae TaxID=2591008 RepID=A0A545U5F6_9GAMM|nr:uroporphyrinogen-III C-methyltransferase [Exilibacterium tricleocarpae]TQV84696.1 uroporphyrinogen-III C-methyltransferase [Exilibacterium tricleocarpae]
MSVTPLPACSNTAGRGRVALVGAGPGDPELLTVKALRCIQMADLILFDRLVSAEIRALFPPRTRALYVGKAKGCHSVPQDRLNRLLIAKALRGFNVCRLKGGDAFVFGRGGEEMLALRQAGIAVEVVPGITAASGCTSYAGIPLTHRGVSQGCTLVTAHGEKALSVNWTSLAQAGHTLVFYMGLSKAGLISTQLRNAGMSAQVPVALIENGCRAGQRVVRGRLDELASLVQREAVRSPALIVVGDVVALADQLHWFGQCEPDGGELFSATVLKQLSA